MSERYDSIAAAHYAAYRPPLHQRILRSILPPKESFSVGVDAGCGTGYSAVALAEYCERVYGVDPSLSMLTRATANERVVYLAGTAEQMPLRENSVEIVTFGGSLHYADTGAASDGIRRICRQDATVIAYDFDVLLEPVLKRLGMDSQASDSDYDHRAGFAGIHGFTELDVRSQRVSARMSASGLAHILLSDSYRLDQFVTRHNTANVFPALVTELQAAGHNATIEADLYCSKYHLTKTK